MTLADLFADTIVLLLLGVIMTIYITHSAPPVYQIDRSALTIGIKNAYQSTRQNVSEACPYRAMRSTHPLAQPLFDYNLPLTWGDLYVH